MSLYNNIDKNTLRVELYEFARRKNVNLDNQVLLTPEEKETLEKRKLGVIPTFRKKKKTSDMSSI